jgi:hypothetical protein
MERRWGVVVVWAYILARISYSLSSKCFWVKRWRRQMVDQPLLNFIAKRRGEKNKIYLQTKRACPFAFVFPAPSERFPIWVVFNAFFFGLQWFVCLLVASVVVFRLFSISSMTQVTKRHLKMSALFAKGFLI